MKTWQNLIWILGVGVSWSYMVFVVHHVPWASHELAGLTVMVPAYCLWALARLQLGRSFAIRAQAKDLVMQGLYSKIQNPVYVFGGIFLVGLITFFGHPVWYLFLLILIPLQLARIRKERQALEAKFGDTYREYRRRTWF